MKKTQALNALAALGQETRLDIFRRLIREFPNAMPAGDLARTLAVPQSTLSAHLTILSHAGLIASNRQGRTIRYSADADGVRDLLGFLINDCCRGQPQICAQLVAAASPACGP